MDLVVNNLSEAEKVPSLSILVVDDDSLNQRLMRILLTREGHKVEVASDGLEAFEAIKIQKFDIVFMDLQMPVMGGLEAGRRIREWENGGQHTFIVALTASYLPENGQTLFEAGIDNYISKPFEVEHIQRLLKYSLKTHPPSVLAIDVVPQQESTQIKALDTQKGIEYVGGDPNVYRELLSDFVQELPEKVAMIRRYFSENNLQKLSWAAHNLTGVSANLGALQLSEYAGRLDMQSDGGYTESVKDLLEEIGSIESKFLEVSLNFLAGKN